MGILAVLIAAIMGYFYYAPVYSLTTFRPVQPIPYSHKQHAGELGIDCQYCHIYARRAEFAGVPPVAKCMNCHVNLNSETDAINTLKKHFDGSTQIAWNRVYNLPEHVWFSHKRHIVKNIPCQKCHGPVETMEVNGQAVIHRMGFCLECHQQNNAPTDCWTCHT